MNKKELRQDILTKRNRLSHDAIFIKSGAIANRLAQTKFFQKATTIGLFNSFGSEVNTKFLIDIALKQKKTIALPTVISQKERQMAFYRYCAESHMQTGAFGIQEMVPKAENEIASTEFDLLILPGVVFNPNGDRIGYGGGFYDRYCKNLNPNCQLVAIAFDLQIIDEIWQTTPQDVKIPLIVTETKKLYTKST